MDDHAHHQHSDTGKLIALGATGGVIAAPYALPLLGVGNELMTRQIITICQNNAGDGLASIANGVLGAVPGIGPTLAAGGWANAFTSGLLGVGGTLLGNYISKHYDREGHIPWGKVIKYTALATSLLVALPSILSGLSMGLTFLAFTFGGAAFASSVAGMAGSTLGLMGGMNVISAGAGLAGLLPHLVTCGAAALPILGGLWLGDKTSKPAHGTPSPLAHGPLRLEGRLQPAAHQGMAHAY